MSISTITAFQAQQKIAEGAVCIDIRQAEEFLREHIQGAVCTPLAQLQATGLPEQAKNSNCIIFYCKSGGRTGSACNQLVALNTEGNREIFLLQDGLNGWKSSGFLTEKNQSQPIEMQRQVQISAGSLILLSMLLGTFINPLFYILATFVGAGLMFAGISGFCGMAIFLAKMPWNKV